MNAHAQSRKYTPVCLHVNLSIRLLYLNQGLQHENSVRKKSEKTMYQIYKYAHARTFIS
jgi:hypothetical protein